MTGAEWWLQLSGVLYFMAKLDFCFTFYDGDATRDMAHMNRLERGAYMDIIIQQRQRGHLSLDDIKKILSRDFDSVWGAIEWVMKIDTGGKYFVEWLDVSIEKAKAASKKQKENVENRYQTSTKPLPNYSKNLPLEDGDGYEDVNECENVVEPEFELLQYPTFEDFWNAYDKKRGDVSKIKIKWSKLSQSDKEAIMDYIPKYIFSQPDKQYRKDPLTFLNNKSWNDEIIEQPTANGINKNRTGTKRTFNFTPEQLGIHQKSDH